MFAVVDCNNFFVSCERVADPRLEGVPCVVASNVGGVIVARSAEAKALGIKMAQPYFQVKALCEAEGVVVKSGNFELYSRLSREVMEVVGDYAPAIEVYSIDEAFLDWAALVGRCDLVEHGRKLRAAVKEKVGIPVSVGIAPTKVLAKIANEWAKNRTGSGVFSMETDKAREKVLKELPVEEVWGIGDASADKLKKLGIYTAWQMAVAPVEVVRKALGVGGERVARELAGTSCGGLTEGVEAAKSIQCTRSFPHPLKEIGEIREAVATFVARAAEKLREDGSLAGRISVFIRTSRFAKDEPQYSAGEEVSVGAPTDNTGELMMVAERVLEKIFKSGYRYKKAGVSLGDIQAKGSVTRELFDPAGQAVPTGKKREGLMAVYDSLVEKYGRDKIFFAAMGKAPAVSQGDGEDRSTIPIMKKKDKAKGPRIRFVDGA